MAVTAREKNEFSDNKSDKRTYTIHALLIEDNPGDVFLLKQIVRDVGADSIDIVHTSRLAAGIKTLNETNIDVVLLDLNLPDSSGLDTLLSVVNANSAVPVIVLTGMDDKELPVKAMQSGAQDFLTKGNFDGELLRRSIRYSIERKSTEALLKDNIARLSRRNKFETIISTVTRSVHKSIDIQEVLENSVSSLKDNIERADIVVIYLVENTTAILKAHRGLSKEYINKAGRIPYPKGFTWKTLTEEKPIYVADTDQDDVLGAAGRKSGIKSYLSTPIFSKGRAIGTLNINSLVKNAFGAEEINLLEIISQQIEVAINNARQAEALKISETRLAEAQRMAHIGNWEWNINTNELWWSVEIYKIFGLDPKEFGATYDAFINTVHPEDRELVISSVKDALEEETSYSIDHRIVLADGIVRIVHEQGEVYYDDQGKPVKMIGTVQDITERIKMEDELQRTRNLESLGVLAGGIAHDFNNMLTAILGNVSLVKQTVTDDEWLYKRLESMEKASIQAKGLTQQLLTFAKGGAPIKKSADIKDLLRLSVNFTLSGSNVKPKFHIQNDLWKVDVDENQLSQVINNLTINADQAMPDGGYLNLSAENIQSYSKAPLPKGRYIKISVADSGVGIPEANLQKIFNPYFSTKDTGSGLGLTTCYSIIKKHGGHIEVESAEPSGAVFTIYLPASTDTKEEQNPKNLKRIMGKGRVLVMDDEELVRDLLSEMLVQIGYDVETAEDGDSAIEKYENFSKKGKSFDLVILDLTVPGGKGGVETLKHLSVIDPNVRAVAASGYTTDPVIANFEEYGFKGSFAKPFNIEDLGRVLVKIMSDDS